MNVEERIENSYRYGYKKAPNGACRRVMQAYLEGSIFDRRQILVNPLQLYQMLLAIEEFACCPSDYISDYYLDTRDAIYLSYD